MFLGYTDSKKGYRCFNPIQNKVHVTRDVAFHETIPYFGHECSLQGEKNEEVKTHGFHELSMFFNEDEGEGGNYESQTDVDTPSTNIEPEPSTNGNQESIRLVPILSRSLVQTETRKTMSWSRNKLIPLTLQMLLISQMLILGILMLSCRI